MFCGECGTENPDTNSFCKNCGKALRRQQQAGAAVHLPSSPAPAVPVSHPPQAATAAPPQPGAKPPRNWLGIGSIIFGILAWLLIPYVVGGIAVILGAVSVYKIKKEKNTIAIAGIIGAIIAIIAMLVNFFYIFIF